MSSPAKLCAIQHQSMIQLRLYRSSSNYINSISDFFPKSHRRVAPPLPQPPSSKAQPTAESFTTGSTTRSSTHRKLRRIKRPTSSSLTFNFRTHSRAPLQFDPALNVTGNCCSSVHQRSCLLPLSSSRPWIVAERVSQFIAISVSVIYFSLVAVAREAIGPPVMEESKSHFHYNHTDPCNRSRWNVRESFEFIHTRPWQRVLDFYSDLVRGGGGSSALSILFPPNKILGGRMLRVEN